jgi:hypothetical protein
MTNRDVILDAKRDPRRQTAMRPAGKVEPRPFWRCDMTTRAEHKKTDDLQHDGGGGPHAAEKSKKDLDRELDKALSDSFPSSDPPAISQPTETEPAGDPKVKP